MSGNTGSECRPLGTGPGWRISIGERAWDMERQCVPNGQHDGRTIIQKLPLARVRPPGKIQASWKQPVFRSQMS